MYFDDIYLLKGKCPSAGTRTNVSTTERIFGKNKKSCQSIRKKKFSLLRLDICDDKLLKICL